MNVRFKQKFLFLIFLTLAFSVFSAFLKVPAQEKTPYNALLTPAPVEKNPVIKKILSADEIILERAKIEYLLARMKQSPYKFIRNGEEYGGTRAAMHITWKYRRLFGNVKTVREFIEDVASRSKMTGQAYLVKFSENQLYPIEEILNNELRVLDEYLQSSAKSPEV